MMGLVEMKKRAPIEFWERGGKGWVVSIESNLLQRTLPLSVHCQRTRHNSWGVARDAGAHSTYKLVFVRPGCEGNGGGKAFRSSCHGDFVVPIADAKRHV